jgi:hypothetical protein
MKARVTPQNAVSMMKVDESGVSYEDVWWLIQCRDLPPESKLFAVEAGVEYKLYACASDAQPYEAITFFAVADPGDKDDAPVMTVEDLRQHVRLGRARAVEPKGPALVCFGPGRERVAVVAVELQTNGDPDHEDYGHEAILLHVDFDALAQEESDDA